MKLLLFYLLAVLSGAGAGPAHTSRILARRKLQEVLKELSDVRQSLRHSQQLLSTPPQNVEDCCCLAALQCYRSNMAVQFGGGGRSQVKLGRSLKHHLTVRGLDFCHTGNATTSCQTCESFPKEKTSEFFNRLESLIQRAVTKLSLD